MFSGGDYEEVARWLGNFVNSHAKRESPRIEAVIVAGDPRSAVYGVQLFLGGASSPRVELDARTVADNRGSLGWCTDLAAQVRGWARDLLAATPSPPRSPCPSASRSARGRA
jgi:hypothetical protein